MDLALYLVLETYTVFTRDNFSVPARHGTARFGKITNVNTDKTAPCRAELARLQYPCWPTRHGSIVVDGVVITIEHA